MVQRVAWTACALHSRCNLTGEAGLHGSAYHDIKWTQHALKPTPVIQAASNTQVSPGQENRAPGSQAVPQDAKPSSLALQQALYQVCRHTCYAL